MNSLRRLLLAFVLPLYLLDQVSKWLVVWNFSPPAPGSNFSQESHVVVENFFTIVRVHN